MTAQEGGTQPGVPVVEFQGISKQFGSVKANAQVSFKVRKGSIHGIVGENGAGKSTLMSILYGYYQADSGQILLNGQPAPMRNSQEAIQRGIGKGGVKNLDEANLSLGRAYILAKNGPEARKAFELVKSPDRKSVV